ncbi:MAG: response regulator, partial [Firmicutes bacterium]|nr:response regulator [Bacillota bacterium]
MYNILICDDEKDIVNALRIYLTNDEYRLFSAYNGEEALKVIRENDIHLVLLDIMMPVMDGMSAMEAIRQEYNMPIILIS